ncbi:MAG TPA: hypothetical protein PLF88_04230 [Opitutaceae bacterium]|nr:hypothetical protein [Opitutaceae bacterium]HRJ47461.1 hypothetical protein [Opitutaceae bacterium]
MPPFTVAQAATSAPLDPSNPVVFLGLLIGGLVTLAVLANTIDAMIQRHKRRPSLDKELSDFAKKTDLAPMFAGLADAARRSELQTLERKVADELAAMRNYNTKTTRELSLAIDAGNREIRDKMDLLRTSISTEFQTLYRALGKIEGVTLEDRSHGD